MKKVMMMAMMMVASATAFAGDSDGLKAILKAKTYNEANQLLQQNVASLADNAEKARAYNHVLDLVMDKVNAETKIITEKTGRLVAIKVVTDENDLMIINKSGVLIRLKVADVRVMGRATQGVRLINLSKKNDTIASVCKVTSSQEEDVEEAEVLNEELPENAENTENSENSENNNE